MNPIGKCTQCGGNVYKNMAYSARATVDLDSHSRSYVSDGPKFTHAACDPIHTDTMALYEAGIYPWQFAYGHRFNVLSFRQP